jgi:putative glutamine amidotransferase
VNRKPLKIGLSPRFLHRVPPELGFRGKTLQYFEQTVAHWLMTAGALVFMVPSIAGNGLLRRGNIRVADYGEELDALVLQGGADVSPLTYGETPLRPAWAISTRSISCKSLFPAASRCSASAAGCS